MIQFQFENLCDLVNDFSGLFLSWFKCKVLKLKHNKRLKRDCQRVAFPVPMSRGGYGCCG
ncbi:hypothetical protein EAY27_20215 [Vibrio anguillarum]|nr:hypothetical protein [Vibrio anguillarum]MBF4279437.1 hypothetical protein [Vibrio anguillarum]MBF4301047.1 hypothetical protein [Vibrio anguillarum]MBF4337032.1 hypothetical protein [Vibrio anguillarum]MBF4364501.1 hypothetical protein [Vibrio anguillarum]